VVRHLRAGALFCGDGRWDSILDQPHHLWQARPRAHEATS